MGSSAVIFISLIAYFSNSRSEIIKATVKVILVKFVVSPFSPLTAYFAVGLQGILGYLLFFNGFNNISPIIHGFLSLLFSSIQKIFILTLIFGVTLWESINVFLGFVVSQLPFVNSANQNINFSYLLVGSYMFVHLVAGIIIGIYAARFPKKYEDDKYFSDEENYNIESSDININNSKKKKRNWWKRPSGILVFVFSIVLIFLSFTLDELDSSIATRIIIMLVRSIIIILVWFYFISPILLKYVRMVLLKKKQERTEEIEEIVVLFPHIKSIIKNSWTRTESVNGIKRIYRFLDLVLINFLRVRT